MVELDRPANAAPRQHFERTSGRRSQRASNGLLSTIAQRLKGAVLKGVVAALLVGAGAGCATATRTHPVATQPAVTVQQVRAQYDTISAKTMAKLMESLEETRPHAKHLWRDTPPFNADGTLNGYIEIPRGELTKHEFDIASNQRAVDRQLPAELVGYPINYGYVPQTISYDGDPFDVLVLGPPLPGGTFVKGKIVGLMYMDDEKGPDMKVVISPVDAKGKPLYRLTTEEKARVGGWFDGYKRWEAHLGKWARVTGWGDAGEGKRFVDRTHGFFQDGLKQAPEIEQLHEQAILPRPMRVLITGFEPWGGRTENMSGEVVRRLTSTSMTGVSLETMVLPVEFERAAELAIAEIDRFQPDLVLALGESPGLKKLEIERYAENRDNDGTILAGGRDRIDTVFDMNELHRLTDRGTDALEVVVNGSPGVFVCNDLFYRLLAHFGDRGPKILFAHVPALADRTLDDVSHAVDSMLKSAVRIMQEREVASSVDALIG
jgi:inorganic pyrophosphatase/pyrrolidone-carboxylate peptidase